ncbi:glycoside hydrolase [Podospora australis]|uniref:Glycoside hydrolase n=1 Tax=Podospora australis TaxID=1536484 RepID=A0AAN7AKF3_9PEZI|nr:glycoside hydrolase [Podospora australis]
MVVPSRIGSLAARAIFLISSHRHQNTNKANYDEDTLTAARAVQGWYNGAEGIYDTTGWWNSANVLTTLTDWATYAGSNTGGIDVPGIIANTFKQAQLQVVTVQKTLSAAGMVSSKYLYEHVNPNIGKRGFDDFLNQFYDDEGWWALALIRSWDVTKNKEYLDMAESIFRDMQNGTDAICGGGSFWNKDRKYKNAITNELYLSVAASLANRVAGSKDKYLKIAQDQWAWFKRSGMINKDNLINDGLRMQEDGKCVNNGLQTWSYNQGVVLGGLVELSKATGGDQSYIAEAVAIGKAAVKALTFNETTGIIREIDRCEPNCGDDGLQFKGIFMRNLHYLYRAAPHPEFERAIIKNADSIWANNRNGQNQMGIDWRGPPNVGRGPTAGTHGSAMDVLVGAMGVVRQ